MVSALLYLFTSESTDAENTGCMQVLNTMYKMVVQTQDMERHGPVLNKLTTPFKGLDPDRLALGNIDEGHCLARPPGGREVTLVAEFRLGLVVPSECHNQGDLRLGHYLPKNAAGGH